MGSTSLSDQSGASFSVKGRGRWKNNLTTKIIAATPAVYVRHWQNNVGVGNGCEVWTKARKYRYPCKVFQAEQTAHVVVETTLRIAGKPFEKIHTILTMRLTVYLSDNIPRETSIFFSEDGIGKAAVECMVLCLKRFL